MKSEAKAKASAKNGKLGGRPVVRDPLKLKAIKTMRASRMAVSAIARTMGMSNATVKTYLGD